MRVRFDTGGAPRLEPAGDGLEGALAELRDHRALRRRWLLGAPEGLRRPRLPLVLLRQLQEPLANWCNMADCGNRAKAREYRRRQREPKRRRPPRPDRQRVPRRGSVGPQARRRPVAPAERAMLRTARPPAVRHPAARGASRARRRILDLPVVARHHQLGELLERGLVHRLVDGDAALLHDVDAVAELEEMRVVVVDHDDRDAAAGREILDEVDDEARLARAHGRERLVQEQDLRRRPHRRAPPRSPAAVRRRAARPRRRRSARARGSRRGTRGRACACARLSRKRSGPKRRQLVPEEQVHVDRELRDQRQILVDGLDPVGARVRDRAQLDALAADDHLAPVLRVEPAQDLDERALAGSVVADEAEHLALAQDEVDAAQDDERAEALGHAAHLERDLGRGGGGRRRALRAARSCLPRAGDEPVELRVQRHRDDDHDADPHVEVVRADADHRQPVLEDADEDRADEGADDRSAPAGERRPADHAGADRVEDVVDAEVARVEAPVLDRVDDADQAGEEGAEHEAPDLDAPDRHARLGGADEVAARGDDPDAEARALEQHGGEDRDPQQPEELGPLPGAHELAREARPRGQRESATPGLRPIR